MCNALFNSNLKGEGLRCKGQGEFSNAKWGYSGETWGEKR